MRINPTVAKCSKKALSVAKKIRPGHIMFGAMLVMTCMNRCSTTTHQSSVDHSKMMQWSYEMGEQRIRDSIKIVELQNKIAADSMKQFHNIAKKTK